MGPVPGNFTHIAVLNSSCHSWDQKRSNSISAAETLHPSPVPLKGTCGGGLRRVSSQAHRPDVLREDELCCAKSAET
jgi:hypothetical protein